MPEIKEVEQWCSINDYPDYLISSLGNVISNKRGISKHLKPILSNVGYYVVFLCKNGKYKLFNIHKLVALHFIQAIDNCTIVNHIDANKLNNNYINLERCDYSHNLRHAYKTTRKAHSGIDNKKYGQNHTYKTSKLVIDMATGIYYYNVGEAARAKNLNTETLRGYLEGDRKNKTSFIYA